MLRTTALAAAALLVVGAASAQDARIAYADLDLSTAAGVADLDARIQAAAERLCADARATGSLLSDRAYCEKAVREAALESLPRNARADYVSAPRSADI